jgi:hypothetical protein
MYRITSLVSIALTLALGATATLPSVDGSVNCDSTLNVNAIAGNNSTIGSHIECWSFNPGYVISAAVSPIHSCMHVSMRQAQSFD